MRIDSNHLQPINTGLPSLGIQNPSASKNDAALTITNWDGSSLSLDSEITPEVERDAM